MENFGVRLGEAMKNFGPICVGIDPHASLLRQWGLNDDIAGLREFSLRCVEIFAPQVASIKPQSAFFERFGSAGIQVLEEVLLSAREKSVLTILDVKRGDIGSTMAGYAQAYLDEDSPLRADAITLSPYLGVGALVPAFELAKRTGRGIFTLTLTSNKEGSQVQHCFDSARVSVAEKIIHEVSKFNENLCDYNHFGPFGLVVGATTGNAVTQLGVDLNRFNGPILAPGFGAQGATATQVKAVFGDSRNKVLASTSRAVLQAGPICADISEATKKAISEVKAVI